MPVLTNLVALQRDPARRGPLYRETGELSFISIQISPYNCSFQFPLPLTPSLLRTTRLLLSSLFDFSLGIRHPAWAHYRSIRRRNPRTPTQATLSYCPCQKKKLPLCLLVLPVCIFSVKFLPKWRLLFNAIYFQFHSLDITRSSSLSLKLASYLQLFGTLTTTLTSSISISLFF